MQRTVARIETAQPPARSASTHANRFVVAAADFEAHSPFLMMMEDWFAPPSGFPTHPHRGMETVTIVLEGSLEHRDHTGGQGALAAGDVQWMTAGKGVMHSEMPGPKGVHSLQLWLNLPAAQKLAPARYLDQRGAEAPVIAAGDGAKVKVYAGRQGEVTQPHGSSYPMGLVQLRLEAGGACTLQIPSAARAFLYVLDGSAKVGADGAVVEAGQSAWIDPNPTPDDSLDELMVAADGPLRAVLFYGEPIEEPVVAYGPFVMNTTEEIRQAFADYQSGALV